MKSPKPKFKSRHVRPLPLKQQGLTLIEVLIAVIILAVVGVISQQSLDVSLRGKESVERNLAILARVDRVWALIEADLKNALSHSRRQNLGPGSGGQIPGMIVENGGDYWMTVLRGGHSNPLNFARTEVIRVGYRVQENVLWRDVWFDLSSTDVDLAAQQQVMDDIEEMRVRLLPTTAASFSNGPWSDRWPVRGSDETGLPLAIEITMVFEDEREITRLYSLVKGE